MKLFRLDAIRGREIDLFGSEGFTLARLVRRGEELTVSVAHLAPGGVIGDHQAVGDQLLLVVQGAGTVRGAAGEALPVSAGQAVLWRDGEWHETRTEGGLIAFVLEAPSLQLEQFYS